MWYSFHIYFINPQSFFEIISNEKYSKIKKFFIHYTDFEGIHVRLRLFIENKYLKFEIANEIMTDFSDYIVLEKFYDPEYNIFGNKLAKYELYSEILSQKIIQDKIYAPSFESVLQPVKKLIFDTMGNKSLEFISRYIDYWNLLNTIEVMCIEKQNLDIENKLLDILYTFWIDEKDLFLENYKQRMINESLLFKIIHMTFNKIGYSITDELKLMKNIIKE